ncbi:hypothetical protein TSUD_135320 [Trifolium subterraneum]|uniref:Uncharacterized protein n=1 Tax=Trifolium subterraneum TaxID=3900 RepID=A0A2Z6P1A1_TRISU|nr:hypothetical protein TSUD_135320 [Trifolium subterraneum]
MSKEFEDGVKEFVKVVVAHAEDTSKIICPCLKCCYGPVSEKDLATHLMFNGIDKTYTCWTMHGEEKTKSTNLRSNVTYTSNVFEEDTQEFNCVEEFDRVEEFVNVIEEDLRDCLGMFDRLVSDSEKPLYDGCTKFTRLSAVLKLFNLKIRNGWSDKSFTDLLTLLKDMFPEKNMLPSRTYEAKRMLCSIGMSHERIHACPNDCILFRNEYASLNMCPKCSASRYKKGTAPAKALWYFPIIPRFRRMYRNAEDAKNLTWHSDERVVDGMLRHPADSPQWAKIDNDYLDFGQEPRNLRLALSTDGINPHGIQSCSHITSPVILMIYNLPPSLCMKRKFLMLTMLISGPRQPGNDIDVYLAPLIEDLKFMWETGVEVYDECRQELFNLRAMLFGTINDFPAYGNLSGYSIKGKCACPICEERSGQPVGLNSASFVSYIGVISRLLVPLDTKNWRQTKNKVLAGYKENVWEAIQKAYVVGDECRRYVLREAGKLHRRFRTDVRKKYLKDSDGNYKEHPPRDLHPQITQDHWDSFVARCKTDEFQKLSKENRERALDPEYLYRGSRKGYARIEDEMIKEGRGDEPPLLRVWKAAHGDKNGVIDNENVQRILDKCEELEHTLPEEEVENRGRNDILYQALDRPKYTGRVMAMGFGVCPKDMFSPEVPASKQKSVDNIHAMYNQVIERLNILEREKEERQRADKILGKQYGVSSQQPEALEREQPPSVKDSCNPVDFETIPKGISSIKIYVASPSRTLVARGKLHNTDGDTVHGKKLPPRYVKVTVEVALVEDAPLPVPVEDGS